MTRRDDNVIQFPRKGSKPRATEWQISRRDPRTTNIPELKSRITTGGYDPGAA